jgi:DNA-binding MarR family transcriptional regulator
MKKFDLKDLLKQIPVWDAPIKFKSREEVLTANEKKVLSFLRACGKQGATIKDIVENTNVKKSTVTAIIKRYSLFIKKSGEIKSRFGRAPRVYKIKTKQL